MAPWVRSRIPVGAEKKLAEMRQLLISFQLHSVCQSARCPNIASCFSRGIVTFMILGDVCTRNCRFCATSKGKPTDVDSLEPTHIAAAAGHLRLDHVVITSVTRDDLVDGGSSQFAQVVAAIRLKRPQATIEVLIPDLKGSRDALLTIIESEPDIIGHNVETVPRLYPKVRPDASFETSLHILRTIKELAGPTVTKSGFMVGLGEQDREVLSLIRDLRSAGCDVLTIGQYLRPSRYQLPVTDYIHPSKFAEYKRQADSTGFTAVLSDPLVRSSFNAGMVAKQVLREQCLDLGREV